MHYDEYNREERYLCSHLFRLLHEPNDDYRALRQFLGCDEMVEGFRVLAEVALIRDAYHERRSAPNGFMDKMTRLLMTQEDAPNCRVYSKLPGQLAIPSKTHPKHIRQKGIQYLTPDEKRVYGAMQGMFNAKPDMAICCGNQLVVYEAKFTMPFDDEQLERTRKIGEVWRELLFEDLGFTAVPELHVLKLGMGVGQPGVSWESILEIAETVYPEGDRTRQAIRNAVSRFGKAKTG